MARRRRAKRPVTRAYGKGRITYVGAILDGKLMAAAAGYDQRRSPVRQLPYFALYPTASKTFSRRIGGGKQSFRFYQLLAGRSASGAAAFHESRVLEHAAKTQTQSSSLPTESPWLSIIADEHSRKTGERAYVPHLDSASFFLQPVKSDWEANGWTSPAISGPPARKDGWVAFRSHGSRSIEVRSLYDRREPVIRDLYESPGRFAASKNQMPPCETPISARSRSNGSRSLTNVATLNGALCTNKSIAPWI